jgi:hypothetical protein
MYKGFKVALIAHYIHLSDVISTLFINVLFPFTYLQSFRIAQHLFVSSHYEHSVRKTEYCETEREENFRADI